MSTIAERQKTLSSTAIKTHFSCSTVVEPLHNEENQLNDPPRLNENIANNEHEAHEKPALRRSTRERRSAISDDYVLYQIESGE